ncbi:hypothetical protein EBX31_03970 [bacterium]|nr:hypothetical protein [bacterium]
MKGSEWIDTLKKNLPPGGLFQEKSWRWSDRPFVLEDWDIAFLDGLGRRLHSFLKAADKIYRGSAVGEAPGWIADWLDQGKPDEVVRLGRDQKGATPRILRPDLIRTNEGWALTEIDSVPGGVGLTAWLQEQYTGMGHVVLGGKNGMREMVAEVLGESGEVVVSHEATDYRPEWEWLLGSGRVKSAEDCLLGEKKTYRFFEMFDWMNLESIRSSWSPQVKMDAPPKAYLEEKLWWAIFWMKPLEDAWRKELGEGFFRELRALVPRAWPLRPMELPPEAVMPELGIQSWSELEGFSQKARDLVIKISGFSPRAWGSRGVFIGSDHPKERWVQEVRRALGEWTQQPHLLQKYAHPASVTHPVWNEERGEMEEGKWRLRICPYYLVTGERVELRGALATLCPTNKKLIHGMQDAVMVPVGVQKGPNQGP